MKKLSLFLLLSLFCTFAQAKTYTDVGDTEANIVIDAEKPSVRASFKCGTDKEQYWFGISRQISGSAIENEKDIFYLDENDRLKWDIEFKEKPETNVFEWELLAHPDLEFLYQTPLTDKERADGVQREEDIDGSYAVYIKNKSGHHKRSDGSTIINYMTGKLAHMPRPLCIDAEEVTSWAELRIKEVSIGVYNLKITVDQDFLNWCSYPMVLDPTLGITSVGGTYTNAFAAFGTASYIVTATGAGMATEIVLYSETTAQEFKTAIYHANSDGNRLTSHYTKTSTGNAEWTTVDISADALEIVSSTSYYPTIKVDAAGHGYRYDTGSSGDLMYVFTAYAGDMPAVGPTTAATTSRVSLYINYTTETVALIEPTADSVIQRVGTTGTVIASGTYISLDIDHIQARIVNAPAGAAVAGFDWTTIDATPSGNVFNETITSIPTGGPYELQVRTRNSGDAVLATDAGTNDFFVGANFMVIGQSNGAEWFKADQHTSDENYTAHAQTSKFYNGAWSALTFDGSVSFANSMRLGLGIPIGVLAYAVDATPITDWESTDAAYIAAVAGVDFVGGIEGIIWIQGESDGFNAMSQATYNTNLTDLISDFRGETNIPAACPFVISLLGRYSAAAATDAEWEAIREAQRAVVASGSNLYTIEPFDHAIENSVHRDALGYTKNARKATQAFLVHNGIETEYASPTLTYSLLDSSTVRIKVTHTAGSDFTPTTGIVGFIASGSGVSVASGSRTSATLIDIPITGDTADIISVFLGYGKQGTVDYPNFPRDNSALALEVGTCGLTLESGEISYAAPDTTDPVCTILTPAASSGYYAGWEVSGAVLSNDGNLGTMGLTGTASDNIAVTSVTWACPECTPSSGTASGTTSWEIASGVISEGDNVFTVTANDAWSNTGADSITVTYDSIIGYALPGAFGLGDVGTFCSPVTARDPISGKIYIGGACPTTRLINRVGSYCHDLEITDIGEDLNLTTCSASGWIGTLNTTNILFNKKQDN